MKKALILLVVLVFAALLVFGCTRGDNYQTGSAAYGQPAYQGQGYVGGGCGVAGPEPTEPLSDSIQRLAA